MTDQELDSLMKRALLDALKNEWSAKIDTLPPLELSARCRRSMRKMLADPQGWARKRARPVWKKALQTAASVLIVCSLTLGSLMAVSPTVRAAVIQWVVEWYETHIVYRYSGEPILTEMPQYEITELPDGYIESEEEETSWPGYVGVVYRNEMDESAEPIYFDYVYMQEGSASDFVTEHAEVITIAVNGLEGQLFLPEDQENKMSTITWIDTKSDLQFTIDAVLGRQDILHIAESVSLSKTTK